MPKDQIENFFNFNLFFKTINYLKNFFCQKILEEGERLIAVNFLVKNIIYW